MYKITRLEDNAEWTDEEINFLHFDKLGRYYRDSPHPEIGTALIIGPIQIMYKWLTTPIKKIITNTETQIKFKTKNSTYEIIKLS